jgi:16S rRNA (guanine(966)-N(2))-methyltransferase RsmD
VRESLFNVLAPRIDFAGASVLDLYAGSGALGLEALSRGATSAVFVESDHRAAAVIAQNISSLGVAAAVRRGPVAAVLAGGADRPVDLVFADPPYDVGDTEIAQMLTALVDGGWVSAGTVVVVERAAAGPLLDWPDGWQPWQARRYGDTRLDLAEFDPAADAAPERS